MKKSLNNVDEIVRKGLEKLDWFYEVVPVRRSTSRTKCEYPGCYKTLKSGARFCLRHKKNHSFLVGKMNPMNVSAPERRAVLKGLSSRQIIDEVFRLTGNKIKVNVKSKKTVIQHARIILEKRNYIIIM
jgi:hypothetical protein